MTVSPKRWHASYCGNQETLASTHGHLLIKTEMGDWMFVYTGSDTVRCHTPGWVCGVDLTADQMRIIGDYCLRMAQRMETPE